MNISIHCEIIIKISVCLSILYLFSVENFALRKTTSHYHYELTNYKTCLCDSTASLLKF